MKKSPSSIILEFYVPTFIPTNWNLCDYLPVYSSIKDYVLHFSFHYWQFLLLLRGKSNLLKLPIAKMGFVP